MGINEREIVSFLEDIKGDNSQACLNMHKHFMQYYLDAKGSKHNHQAWVGGYMQHIKDILNLSYKIYYATPKYHEYKFDVEDSYLVLFLHDIEKPIFYTKNKTEEVLMLLKGKTEENKEIYVSRVRDYFLEKFNVVLSEEIKHALKYIHGEGDDFSQEERVSTPLTSYCHIVDTFSARISYDYNKPIEN